MADTAAGMMIAMSSRIDDTLRGHKRKKKKITAIGEHAADAAPNDGWIRLVMTNIMTRASGAQMTAGMGFATHADGLE